MEVTKAATFPLNLELVKRYKKKTKRRIRNLVNPKTQQNPIIESTKRKKFLLIVKLSLLCMLLIFLYLSFKNGKILDDLRHLSLNQYHFYLYGRPNYCTERFEYENITLAMKKNIYGQINAIEEINTAFQASDNITSIALVGNRGVGKTLTINTIQSAFQWPSNIKLFLWTTIDSQQSHLHRLMKLLPALSTCGYNGLFIDNIPLKDQKIIDEFHKKLVEHCQKSGIKTIVFYVFLVEHDDQASILTNFSNNDGKVQIQNVKTISLRRFNNFDLRRCITFESEKLHLTLSDSIVDEIATNIDVMKSGCKTVVARITRYFSS